MLPRLTFRVSRCSARMFHTSRVLHQSEEPQKNSTPESESAAAKAENRKVFVPIKGDFNKLSETQREDIRNELRNQQTSKLANTIEKIRNTTNPSRMTKEAEHTVMARLDHAARYRMKHAKEIEERKKRKEQEAAEAAAAQEAKDREKAAAKKPAGDSKAAEGEGGDKKKWWSRFF